MLTTEKTPRYESQKEIIKEHEGVAMTKPIRMTILMQGGMEEKILNEKKKL
jgi:hypothetical protein